MADQLSASAYLKITSGPATLQVATGAGAVLGVTISEAAKLQLYDTSSGSTATPIFTGETGSNPVQLLPNVAFSQGLYAVLTILSGSPEAVVWYYLG